MAPANGSARLAGKVVLITGTGGGIGREASLLFAREGAIVGGCDLDEAAASETLRLVLAAGGAMELWKPFDLTDTAATAAWVDAAAAALGGIDVLYNNAAAARGAPFAELTAEDWSYTLRGELDIAFTACRAVWPHLVARGGGCIVNTASTAGLVGGSLGTVAHGAAKGGILSMTRHLAAEGGPLGIRVNSVSPGSIDTPAARIGRDPRFLRSYLPQTLLRRLGTPSDIAHAALFLACDESAFVTGQNLVVDGGRTSTGFVYLD